MGALGACGHVGALDLAVQQLAVPNLRADAETAVKSIAELIRKKHPQEVKPCSENYMRSKVGAGR
jgi:hypothetical protein